LNVLGFIKNVAYDAVDLWTRGRGVERVISDEPIRFRARWSRFYPSNYEPGKFAFLRTHCRPGTAVLDVGAHIGLFTVLMARCVGPSGSVLSFEPTPLTRQALLDTVRRNSSADIVEVREEAVSDRVGLARFHDTGDPLSNANSLVESSRSKAVLTVPVTTVDAVVTERKLTVSCIKIDAEGSEIDIVRGAAATINRCRPALQIEVHPRAIRNSGRDPNELWDLLHLHGYMTLVDGAPIDREVWSAQSDPFEIQAVSIQ
jgi:FkbM family methyltransferase